MVRVLLAETDKNMISLLRAQLLSDGFEVIEHPSYEGLVETIGIAKPAVLILRLVIAGKDRYAPAQEVRQSLLGRTLPIIAIQARISGDERFEVLRYDVDDVLTEPFHAKELSLRIAAVLRRSTDRTPPHESAGLFDTRSIQVGAIALSPSELTMTIHGQAFPLTRTEMKIMIALAESPGQTCDHGWLRGRVWTSQDKPEIHHVQWHINHLRKKLGQLGGCIVTVPRVGYMLDARAL